MFHFKSQIDKDIALIQNEYGYLNNNIAKPEYAFNYWVLSRLYSLDEEMARDYITEYNDKSVDCFVHYEDTKELYLIQCKYYDVNTSVNRKDVSDFLETPIASLLDNNYTKSKELQTVFDRAKNDPEYQINLHFYITNNHAPEDVLSLVKYYTQPSGITATVCVKYHTLDDIQHMYFDDRFTNAVNFNAVISTTNKGTSLDVRPEQYKLDTMVGLRYVMVSVIELFKIYKEAVGKNYSLFEENIREFLGTSSINNGIIRTLNSPEDRENFFYYNNGITIICDKCDTLSAGDLPAERKVHGNQYGFKLYNPQVVNGCQTINSIYEVLSHCNDNDLYPQFSKTSVLVKIYIIDEKTRNQKPDLKDNIVRYTNSQNSINDKAFASASDTRRFLNIQKEFRRRGFLLAVKQSDKNIFSTEDSNKFDELKSRAIDYFNVVGTSPKKFGDLVIDLEKLLKVLLAYYQGADTAFTKGNQVLKRSSDKYKNFSLNIGELFSIDNMINLWLTHKRADEQKKQDEAKRFPVPFYVVGFLGKSCTELNKEEKLNSLYSDKNRFNKIYDFYCKLSKTYTTRYIDDKKSEYNMMIKTSIDGSLFQKTLEELLDLIDDGTVRSFINE